MPMLSVSNQSCLEFGSRNLRLELGGIEKMGCKTGFIPYIPMLEEGMIPPKLSFFNAYSQFRRIQPVRQISRDPVPPPESCLMPNGDAAPTKIHVED